MAAVPIVRLGRLRPEAAQRILVAGRAAEPTYGPVGDLLGPGAPTDLCVERRLGTGAAVFERARTCLRTLGPQRSVATVWPADAQAEEGATVLVALGLGPVTVVAVNRIVGVVDEPRRWGFAYGTLPGHFEVGEEAFVVEHGDDDVVVARIMVTAHVALPGSRLIEPLLTPVQRRFVHRYLDAVEAAASREPS